MKNLQLLFLFAFSSLFATAQTFTNITGGAITDNNTYIYYPIVVSGLSPTTINSTSFGLEKVTINLTHTNDADLRIKLQSPSGSIYVLTSYVGGTGDNYTNTSFADSAVNPVSGGTAPFTGFFRPVDGLVSFNNGQVGNGTWNLMVKDQTVGNTGTVLNWSITFGTHPAGAINFVSSNLPIIVLNTGGTAIPNGTKINGTMGIIYNGPGVTNHLTDPQNNYNGNIGIEIRGAYSASLPQKPYNVELRDAVNIQKDTQLLGMPAGSDWCLIANYNDKVFMRNALAYKLFNEMGHYATRTRYCEVVLNGGYQGIYLFSEAIKRDSNRVAVAHLDSLDNSGNQVTGGYIIKNDYWGTTDSWQLGYHPIGHPTFNVHLVYHYPKPLDITPQQKTYIQTFVNNFETALYGANYADTAVGYQKYIGVSSFLDYLIVNEFARNNDGFKKSCYYHKEKDDSITGALGKLKMGPVWDFDWAYKNIPGCAQYSATDGSGWSYKINDCNPDVNSTGWMVRLLQDVEFQNKLRCRWSTFRSNILSNATIMGYVDSIAIYLDSAQMRHFAKWGNLGVNTGAPEVETDPNTWAGEILKFKTWLTTRLAWLDANMPGTCSPAVAAFSTYTPTTICTGNTIAFNDQSTYLPTSWNWSFPGGTPSTSTLQNPVVTYNTTGTYNVTLTATNAGGTGVPVTFTNFVTINPGPTVTATAPAICNGDVATITATGATSYSWSAGATALGTNTATASPSTTTTYTVTGSDLGCVSTSTVSVVVNPLPVVTVNSTSICSGDTATLVATGASSFVWSAGATPTGTNTAIASPTSTTTYTVTGSDLSCSASATATVLVSSLPSVSVNSVGICPGDSALLTAAGAASYVWSAGVTITGVNTATVNPTSTTTYTVTGSSLGCSASAMATVTVNSIPSTPTISAVGNVLTSSATTGNQWYLNGVLISGATSQYFTMFVDGIYTVVATNGGCSSLESTPFVYTTVGITSIETDEITLFPNPANDKITIEALQTIENIELFDVTGKLILEIKNNLNKTVVDISKLENGIYYFKIHLINKQIKISKAIVMK